MKIPQRSVITTRNLSKSHFPLTMAFQTMFLMSLQHSHSCLRNTCWFGTSEVAGGLEVLELPQPIFLFNGPLLPPPLCIFHLLSSYNILTYQANVQPPNKSLTYIDFMSTDIRVRVDFSRVPSEKSC